MQNLLPIHVQLENLIKDKIASGEYAMGAPLPSERKMAEAYGINRLTVRAALKNLQKEGLVNAVQGKGTFVCSAKMKLSFSTIRGFGAQLKEQGVVHTSKVLFAKKVSAGYVLSQRFDVEKGFPLFRLTRVRFGNGHALAIDDTYVRYDSVRNIESIDFAANSLYRTFEENNIQLTKALQVLSIYNMYGPSAEILELPDGSPVFCINHKVFDSTARLVEYTYSYVNPAHSSITSYLKK
ncbi:MAG: GntR family transcriptional regulator [Ruthenibacterium sp.]